MAVGNNVPSTLGLSSKTVDQLMALGFTNVSAPPPRRLVASIAGKDGTGKTHFLLTAPPPIFLINIDIGTEGVLEKFRDAGKDVYVYDVRVPKGEKQEIYQTLWHDMQDRISKVFKINEGTLGLDTGSEGYELARLAHFGKLTQVMPHQYTEVKAEWREILRQAYDSTMNTILIHKVKPVYINNTRTKDYELSGFDETNYMVQVALTMTRRMDPEGKVIFGYTIEKCRQRPSLTGLEVETVASVTDSMDLQIDPMVNFDYLLDLVHGS